MKFRLSYYILLLIPVALAVFTVLFNAHLSKIPTDYNNYISYLQNSHDYSSPFSPFLYKSNEVGWSILVFISNILAPGDYSYHLLIGVCLSFSIYLVFFFSILYLLPSGLSVNNTKSYFGASLLAYSTTDIFVLGLSNSLRTGVSLLYFSLFVLILTRIDEFRSLSSFRHRRLLCFLILLTLLLSFAFHSACQLIVLLLFITCISRRIFLRLFSKSPSSFGAHDYIYTLLLIIALFFAIRHGPLAFLYLYDQSSASALGSLKFIVDLFLALVILLLGFKRLQNELVICLLIFCLSFSVLGVFFAQIESFNRLEQYIRLILVILSLNTSFLVFKRKTMLMIVLPVLIASTVLTFTSPSVRLNVFR